MLGPALFGLLFAVAVPSFGSSSGASESSSVVVRSSEELFETVDESEPSEEVVGAVDVSEPSVEKFDAVADSEVVVEFQDHDQEEPFDAASFDPGLKKTLCSSPFFLLTMWKKLRSS